MKKSSIMEKHLGYWLRHVSNHVSASFARRLVPFNVGIGEWVVLNLLDEHEMLASTAIAAMTGMTGGAISKLLDKLYQKKLVSRVESKKDRRCQEIRLTAAGKKLLPMLIKEADANEEAFFGHLTADDQQVFIDELKKIVAVQKWDDIPTN